MFFCRNWFPNSSASPRCSPTWTDTSWAAWKTMKSATPRSPRPLTRLSRRSPWTTWNCRPGPRIRTSLFGSIAKLWNPNSSPVKFISGLTSSLVTSREVKTFLNDPQRSKSDSVQMLSALLRFSCDENIKIWAKFWKFVFEIWIFCWSKNIQFSSRWPPYFEPRAMAAAAAS